MEQRTAGAVVGERLRGQQGGGVEDLAVRTPPVGERDASREAP